MQIFSVMRVIHILVVLFLSTSSAEEYINKEPAECSSSIKDDPFVASEPFENGKTFLVTWKKEERKGDWLFNYGFCQKYGAEMVTIQSEGENVFFLDWATRIGNVRSPGLWLGAQQINSDPKWTWANGDERNYTKQFIGAGEFTDNNSPCLHALYAPMDDNKWRTVPCNWDLHITCQRKG